MTFFELQEALREACPEDRKLTVTIVTGLVTFSSTPRYKDSKDPAVRTFPVSGEEVENGDKKLIALAIESIFPKPATKAAEDITGWQESQLLKQADEQVAKAQKKGK
jgi:hypothetical protein